MNIFKNFKMLILFGFMSICIFPSKVYAKDRDFYDIKNNKVYKSVEWRNDDKKFNELIDEIIYRPEDFKYEFKGKAYSYEKLLDNINNLHRRNKLSYSDAFIVSINNKSIQEEIPILNSNVRLKVISIR
ncbi:hypothetical protein Z969_07700 [Clostridium novyi A str. 4570]|uniref:Uncharacterized protein n=1 Tax=Clostridium novyi A str. 4570 TaxID=1444290 RepID=A0AA88ZSU6_CLONO|nr:hypothetical protein [Clostridium novyi]KGN01814.1 hypothetical protein Z969_07700 [Clostridium novyi A str. 4570]